MTGRDGIQHVVTVHEQTHPMTMVGAGTGEVVVVGALAVAAAGYAAALWLSRHRTPWPGRRVGCWYAGLGCVTVGLTGPIASAARTSFTAHMGGHLLVGMAGPLLLVLGAPLTLTLRALPATRARLLSRALRSLPVRVLTHPVTAATLNAGGLWALYTTDLYRLMHTSAPIHVLVHAHIFLTGYLLAFSLVGIDPNPHRAAFTTRSVVLVVFIAAHSVLAKWVYAHPPTGVTAQDVHAGAQLMYYGGDLVDVTLIVALFTRWYRDTRPVGTRPRTPRPVGLRRS